MEARASRTADLVDRLVDCHAGTAAARIARMDRHQLELVVMHIVRSVDPRWRVTKPLPLPASDEETETIRSRAASILAESPHAIVPVALAVGDAIKAHDPRPRLDIRDTPYTPPEDAA